MKRIGLLGGMSWESSALYYRLINEEVARRLGGVHSADCVLISVDFGAVRLMQQEDRWDDAGDLLAREASRLEAAGADCVLVCTNTMHKVADTITAAIGVPLLHIAEVTAGAVADAGVTEVGLLGTRFTMEEDFYRSVLERRGLRVHVPDAEARERIDRIIFDELVLGDIREESRADLVGVIGELTAAGAEGAILGCTELELLVRPADTPLPLFATTTLHAHAAVDFALGGGATS